MNSPIKGMKRTIDFKQTTGFLIRDIGYQAGIEGLIDFGLGEGYDWLLEGKAFSSETKCLE